jgi:hypothetical protein
MSDIYTGMTTVEQIIARRNEIQTEWKKRFTAACPQVSKYITSKFAGGLASAGITTDEELAAVSDNDLRKMPKISTKGVEFRKEYLTARSRQADAGMDMYEFGEGFNWSAVIKQLRLQAHRDMNSAIDLTSVHRDVPNAAVRALLMQSNAALLSRLADAFSHGIGGT